MDVVLGELEREADAAQDAQRGAERVARHEDLGVILELEHLVDLRVVVGEKGRCWLHGWVKASDQGRVRVRGRVGLTKVAPQEALSSHTHATPHLLEERRLEHHALDAPLLRSKRFRHIAVVPELGDRPVVLASEAHVHLALRVLVLLVIGPFERHLPTREFRV